MADGLPAGRYGCLMHGLHAPDAHADVLGDHGLIACINGRIQLTERLPVLLCHLRLDQLGQHVDAPVVVGLLGGPIKGRQRHLHGLLFNLARPRQHPIRCLEASRPAARARLFLRHVFLLSISHTA